MGLETRETLSFLTFRGVVTCHPINFDRCTHSTGNLALKFHGQQRWRFFLRAEGYFVVVQRPKPRTARGSLRRPYWKRKPPMKQWQIQTFRYFGRNIGGRGRPPPPGPSPGSTTVKSLLHSGDLRGWSRGRVQGVPTPPPPRDDLRFSNTTVFCQKKNYVVYWFWSRARDECTPSLKKSWIRPWNYGGN